jgi:hypothetical protein
MRVYTHMTHCAIGKLAPDCCLNHGVCLVVDICRGFVKHQNAVSPGNDKECEGKNRARTVHALFNTSFTLLPPTPSPPPPNTHSLEESASHADELALTHAKVRPSLRENCLKAAL